ncbi:MAG: hypothetical protein BRD57_05445, partial [Proteobacteria bacterium SW_6_67_9]
RLPRPRPDVCGELTLSPPELIERVAALVPPPRRHRLRYYGVLVPNAWLRPAVTAMAPEQAAEGSALGRGDNRQAFPTAADEGAPQQVGASKARCLWALLLARIYEAFPLTRPHCAGEMRLIALVTDPGSIEAILAHMGEPTRPPPLAPARDPPPGPAISTPAKSWIPRASPRGSIRWPSPSLNTSSTSASCGKKPIVALRDRLAKRRRCARFGERKRALMTPTGPGSP